jgi:hypothetical protein
MEGPAMRFRLGTLMLLVVTLALAAALVAQSIRANRHEATLRAELQAVRAERDDYEFSWHEERTHRMIEAAANGENQRRLIDDHEARIARLQGRSDATIRQAVGAP